MKKILILASNPRKDLNLDDEIRLLRNLVDRSSDRDRIEIVSEPGVQVGDLQALLLRHKPQIVHFCGHGGGEEGLIFKIEGGGEQWVRADALANMFGLNPICSHVKCVLLNACYSENQANAIVNHIDYVVGMSHEIQDNAAIAFSKGFYLALGEGCSIEDSFNFGKNAIQLEISGSSKRRSAVSEAQRKLEVLDVVTNTNTSVPEHLKPILKKKAGINIPGTNPTLSQETRATIQLAIDKTLEVEEDTKIEQYREQVREYLSDRKLEDFEKDLLDALRDEFGLSPGRADQILEEELTPIRQAQQAYATRLKALIKYYPLSDQIKGELQRIQVQRKLTDEEVEEISRPILEQAETAYQENLKQEAQQRYEEEFIRAINAGYPIEDSVRNALSSFQQSLELTDGDVSRIEQPIIVPKQAEYQQRLTEEQSQREEAERKRERESVKRELQRQFEQFELEQQCQGEAQRERMKKPPDVKLHRFEFDVITIDKNGTENSRTRKSAKSFAENLGNQVLLEMIMIPGGTYRMGSPKGEGSDEERPQHSVTVSSFFMGKYPVTQAQWRAVAELPKIHTTLDPDPSVCKGDNRPVERVALYQAAEFCQRLALFTGHQYRLPSEAEWEYACRAGTITEFYFGMTLTPELAKSNAGLGKAIISLFSDTAPVGSYLPNSLGLYDMHGNVWEWCADSWHENYADAPNDGSAWITGGNAKLRLVRGGSYMGLLANCRSAKRYQVNPSSRTPDIGFRVVCAMFPGLF